jgi:hypothetical protein
MKNKNYSGSSKKWLTKKKLLIIVPLLALAVLGISEATNTTYLLHKAPRIQDEPPSQSSGQSSSNTKSSSSSQHDGGPSSATGQGVRQTQASDTNGQSVASTSPSQWSTSASGLITLKSPVANSTFKSGGTISGTARVSKVWYRLVDDNAGVISQGQPLSVVGGKFSATLNFHSYGKTGHLDVYSFNSNGAEVNEVSVPLHF